MVDHVGNEAGWLADVSITKQEVYDYLTKNVTHAGMTQASVPLIGVITPGGAPAADGQAAWNDPAGANDATRQLEIFNSVLARTVGIPKKHMARASLPATGDIGEQVYVTDLQITVEFRDAAADAVLSGTGLAGWHPMNSGIGLFANATGADIEANRVVALTAATGTRNIAKTTLLVQQNVLGVALHLIPTGTNGYVAMPGYGHPVPVRVDPTLTIGATTIEVTAGDYLCASSSAAGDARTRGAAQTSGIPVAGQMIHGVPAGAFARSLEDRLSGAGIGNVMAMLLPAVGSGAEAFRDKVLIYTDLSGTAVSADIQACQASTGSTTQSGTDDTFISAKHLPILAVRVIVDYAGVMAAGGSSLGVQLGPTVGIEHAEVSVTGQGAANSLGVRGTAEVPTRSAGSATVIGNRFRATTIATNMTSSGSSVYQAGYTY